MSILQTHQLVTMKSNKSATILVVDDEQTIREVVRNYLEREGFTVREAADGHEALDALSDDLPALIVLDLMLPGVDGLTITRHVRQRYGGVPIVMLTARGETRDRIAGLDLGADDYIAKPFSPQELVSRVKAVLRRTSEPMSAPQTPLEFDGLRLDPASYTVTAKGESVTLTAREFDLLWFMARHARQVFTRDQLIDQVWGHEFYGDPATVTVHIRRLREKIEADPSKPRYIVTVWGVGYRFDD